MSRSAEQELEKLIGEMSVIKGRASVVSSEFGDQQRQFIDYLADMLIAELSQMKEKSNTQLILCEQPALLGRRTPPIKPLS